MKIWLDTVALAEGSFYDCDCDDDDCAPDDGLYSSYASYASTSFTNAILPLQTLQFAETLQSQAYDGSHWIIYDPVDSGKIGVVDAETYALLECFRTPKTLQEVQADPAYCSSNSAHGVALFANLGFLQNLHQPQSPLMQQPAQTLSAWLHVTNACNLSCHYCYVDKSSESMTPDISQRSVDAVIRSAISNHFKRVKLKYSGGEASLLLSRVLALHDYAVQQTRAYNLDFSASILSNGVTLSQRSIDAFKQRAIGVMISLDGVGTDHDQQRPFQSGKGSFTYVDRTITRLLANNLIPHINVVVSQRNLHGLPKLMEYILDRNLSFTLSYYRDNEHTSNRRDLQFFDSQMINAMRTLFASIEQRLPKRRLIGSLIDKATMTTRHEHTCSAGRNYLVINQNGGVAKCQADLQHAVTTIDADDPLQAIRSDRNGMYALPIESKEGCRSCQWRYWCTGGCPLLTYRITGRNDVKSPNCNIYQALFPEAVRLEGLRLLKYASPIVL